MVELLAHGRRDIFQRGCLESLPCLPAFTVTSLPPLLPFAPTRGGSLLCDSRARCKKLQVAPPMWVLVSSSPPASRSELLFDLVP